MVHFHVQSIQQDTGMIDIHKNVMYILCKYLYIYVLHIQKHTHMHQSSCPFIFFLGGAFTSDCSRAVLPQRIHPVWRRLTWRMKENVKLFEG